jgi:hypothetical protein
MTVRHPAGAVFAVAALLASAPAWAQKPPADLFKGKMKPGLYEDRVEVDMTGVPGIPKEHAKQSQTTQRCMTPEDLAKGLDQDEKGCETSGFKMMGETAIFTTTCKKGNETQIAEVKLTPTAQGMKSELKSTMKQGGQTSTSTMRSESRYLGPCK